MDFALLMFIALLATGLIWAADYFVWAPVRARTAEALQKNGGPEATVDKARREPVVVEYARAFFPVILLVFVLRSFLVEPFRIPSGSMMPGLLAGDFILVNKFTYGLRLPVINRKVVNLGAPKRGDVMVFRFPRRPHGKLHQARHWPAWRQDRLSRQKTFYQWYRHAADVGWRLYLY